MRILFAIGLCILGTVPVSLGQGTIAFNNFSATPGRVWTNAVPGVGTNGGVLAPGPYRVELMYAPIGGTNFNSARVFSITNSGGNGQFFDGSTVFLSGIPAGTGNADTNAVQLYLRGWTGAFADYNSAVLAPMFGGISTFGETTVFLNPVGGAGTALPANLIGWQAINALVLAPPIPEPSTLALGGLGIAALLLFRRRK